jgi:hypothetical protein
MARALTALGVTGLAVVAAANQAPRAVNNPPQTSITGVNRPPEKPLALPHQSGADLLTAFYGDSVAAKHSASLRVLIVLVPDPISSHLDWSYDSQLESLRRAMEQSGYVVDRFWLPWRSNGDTTGGRYGIADSLAGARWPGVMLFRHANPLDSSLALVYVVGDVPTSGVQRLALREALKERQRLLGIVAARQVDTVRIVGPVFSGSSTSLRRAITAWRDSSGNKPRVEIVTGTASDVANLDAFNADFISFRATVHTSSWLTIAAESLLAQKLDILPKELALLHEGTTQFGRTIDLALSKSARKSPLDPASLPLDLAFPMNISSLQVQYARHPDPTPPGADGVHPLAGPRLGLDQREPAALSESPTVVSQLTAPAVEILLAEIERSLSAHHIRAVGIVATDVRDQLFLADELRKRLHDVQIVFFGSNVLFLRPEYRKAIKGALVVSTYPLFPENQYWDLTQPGRERLIFMSEQAEGLFNAVLSQLDAKPILAEFATPMDSLHGVRTRPPTWITVIGTDAIYPVTLADTATAIQKYADVARESRYLYPRTADSVRKATEGSRPAAEFAIPLFLLLLGFAFSFVMLQRRTVARVHPEDVWPGDELSAEKPGSFDQAVLQNRAARSASLLLHRELYVLLRYFCLLAAAASLLLVLNRPRAHGLAASTGILYLLGAVSLPLTAFVAFRAIGLSWRALTSGWGNTPGVSRWRIAAFVLAGRWPRRKERLFWVEFTMRIAVLLLGFLYFIVTLVFALHVVDLGPAMSAVFFQRAVSLTGGVSPAVPLVLSAAAFATWCSWHLMRISLLAEPTVFEEFLVCQDGDARTKYERRRVEDYQKDANRAVRGVARLAGSVSARLIDPRSQPSQNETEAETAALMVKLDWLNEAAVAGSVVVSPPELQRARTKLGRAIEIAERADRFLDDSQGAISEMPSALAVRTVNASALRDLVEKARETLRVVAAKSKAAPAPEDPLHTRFDRRRLEFKLNSIVQKVTPGDDFIDLLAKPVTELDRALDKPVRGSATAERSPGAASSVRAMLLYLIPNGTALAMLAGMIAVAWWIVSGFGQSLEAMVLPRRSWLLGVTAFDLLFRFGVLAVIGLTVWAVYRLVNVWSGIRVILEEIDADLLPAFVDLPARLARVTRLTPFGHASRAEINDVAEEKWAAMLDAFNRLPVVRTKQLADFTGIIKFDKRPGSRSQPFELAWDDYQGFEQLHQALGFCRREGLIAKQATTASTGGRDKEPTEKEWARRCAELYALYVADYVDWVFQHMRYLASFLLIALLLSVVLLASYPFQPQSVLTAVFAVVFVVGVATILYVLVAMNRDKVLSAISNTQAGKVSWDGHFITSLATYGALPLITLVSTEFPEIRDFLFSWVAPLVRALTKG